MAIKHLRSGLLSIDWARSVNFYLSREQETLAPVDRAFSRIAVWSRALERADSGNPALSFVRGVQSASLSVVVCSSAALYIASAGSIRSIVENGLYYSFFREHPAELRTLIGQDGYYLSKSEIIQYHKTHTKDFKVLQEKTGFLLKLDKWYSKVSAIVHGQIPGEWVNHTNLAEISHDQEMLDSLTGFFCEAEELLHILFLITCGRALWDQFLTQQKRILIAGTPGDWKSLLKIDGA